MLNAEKFKNEILEVMNNGHDFSVNEQNNKIKMCCVTNCSECLFNIRKASCSSAMTKWLLSEYREPVKLTKFERDILEYALKNTDFRFITRDDEDKLYFYSVKPRKYNRYWQYLAQNQRRVLSDDLFRFVQWSDEQPTSIKEVLENCEVVEDDLSRNI